MNDKSLELIFEYFKEEYQSLQLTREIDLDIKDFFLGAAKRNLSGLQIGQLLQGSRIEECRDKLVSLHPSNYNCYPIKLGGLKPHLQREAFELDVTLHRHILLILRNRNLIIPTSEA